MAGAIDKKKAEVLGELEGTPATMVGARAEILSDIALSREFADTFLAAICQNFTSTSGSYSLSKICEPLALQRAICYGARAIKTTVKKFDFPPVTGDGTVNGPLDLTEPTTITMGIKATDIGETYPITLSITAGTQTQGSNTFSVLVDDYYLVRSRVSGELVDISVNVSPYTTPDLDTVVGNVISWGSSVASEEEAETWNYNWAKANIASVGITGSGATELTVLTLTNALTAGGEAEGPERSDGVDPLGPGFGNKFYLKRHADYVNTFTIIGTTTENSIEITGVSETDIAKVKYGDVISGTGIPDDNVSIAAVQTADSKLRLSNTGIATANGIVTLTVNSVPFGYQAHDIFCQIEIVAEGLVTNDDWEPIGRNSSDGASNYDDDGTTPSGTDRGADNGLVASTSQFIGLLGFFDPASASGAGSNELTKSASASFDSDGKEYGGTSYPDIEKNPFKPANGGTSKAYDSTEVAAKGITGTQAGGLTDKDLWSGRYIRFDFERANADGDLPEFRYITDSCEKFYYELPATSGYDCGTVTVAAHGALPSDTEPPVTIAKNGLALCVTAAATTSITLPAADSIITISAAYNGGSIPPDGDTSDLDPATSVTEEDPPSSGTYVWVNSPSGADGVTVTLDSYYTIEGNYVVKNEKQYTYTVPSGTLTSSSVWTAVESLRKTYLNCGYNFAQRLLYDKGGSGTTSQNTNSKFMSDTIDDLQGLKSFRDPITTTQVVNDVEGSDASFDTYLTNLGSTSRNEWETSHDALNTYLAGIRTTFSGQNRKGDDNSGGGGNGTPGADNLGATITYTDTSRTNWTANNAELLVRCNKRVAEIDKRIGVPEKTGGGAAAGAFPTGRITGIPGSPAVGEFVPYGRSLYNSVNHMLGQDVDLLGGIIKDVESLTDLVGMVKTARNKYEIFSGRDKEYT